MRCAIASSRSAWSLANSAGTQEGHLRAEFTRHRGDFGAVGRDNNALEAARRQRLFDGIGDERLTAERFYVLAGQALRAAARGDDTYDFFAVQPVCSMVV